MNNKGAYIALCVALILLLPVFVHAQDTTGRAQCMSCSDSDVLTYEVFLTAPNETWDSPNTSRDGQCCDPDQPTDRCIRFIVHTHPKSDKLNVVIASGAPPGGHYYKYNCTNPQTFGTPMCINNTGPHCIVFCEPGANKNVYRIVAAQTFEASPDIGIGESCEKLIWVNGLNEASVTWSSVYPGAAGAYNSFLSCTAGCDTTYVKPQTGMPTYIDYEVRGTYQGDCGVTVGIDTVRVYFYTDVKTNITPKDASICFGGMPVSLFANSSGGVAPYTYTWNTGATTQSISVGAAGKYYVVSQDSTKCNLFSDTVNVSQFSLPIAANAGTDIVGCANNSSYQLNGSVVMAGGGQWSGGGGTFAPSDTTLNAIYTLSNAELLARTATLTLSTTKNGGCPGDNDVVAISLAKIPIVNAGPNQTVCANNAAVTLNGTVTNATGGKWTSSGTGSFSNDTMLNAKYTPSPADTVAKSVTLTLTSTGNGTCNAVTDDMIITISPKPTVNAGPDQTVCANNAVVNLSGSVKIATGGTWTRSGTGTIGNASLLSTSYTPSPADTVAKSVTLTLTSTGNGTCNAVTDDMIITISPKPTVNAGPDQTVCANNAVVNLAGSVKIATGGSWTKSGTGTIGNASLLATSYTPSPADTVAKSVTLTLTSTGNGTCNAVTDDMIITISPKPTVNAGPDQTVCANNAVVNLAGSVKIATGGSWTRSGTGTIGNASLLATSYTPSPADTVAKSVTLTLTSTGNGTCNAVTDDMIITISPKPTVNAGPDQTVCANNAVVNLTGSVKIATEGTWTRSGTGTIGNASLLSTSYTPSPADTVAKSVTLTLTSTGNGTCNAVTDDMIITISPKPTVNAGPDQTVCANNAVVNLAGSVKIATGGSWTRSGTGTIGNASLLATSYTPSPADTVAKSVTLTLTSTGNGTCNAVTDDMIITISPKPTVNAGPDQTVCANNAVVNLAGSVKIATGGTWTRSGTGTIGNASLLATSYTPSPADTAAKSVTLTLTSTGNGTCNAVTDDMIITISPKPTVNAGPDQTVCANNAVVNLAGSVKIATGGTWTRSGTGTIGNASLLATSYTPSPADTVAKSVTLTLTSTGNGTCNAITDDMIITISPKPTVNAGPDQTVCANNAVVNLAGSVKIATGGTWTRSGTGTIGNASLLATSYTPSPADTVAKSVTLTLTSTGNGTCNAVTDDMIITISPKPTVNAGPDQTVCANNAVVNLAGSVKIATGGTWTRSGTGTIGNAALLSTSYTPSPADTVAKSVTLTLTSTGNGTCNAVTDDMIITISPKPTVNAGPDQTVCANNAVVNLTGSVKIATGGSWTRSGTGTIGNAALLSTSYTPSPADTLAKSVTLTLTSTGNGTCNAVTDDMIITISPKPTVNAGPDQTVCANNAVVNLAGSVKIATGGTWTRNGTGTIGNASLLATSYTPSPADTLAKSVTLTLTSTGNGTCNAVTDDMIITISPKPTVNAGPDQTVCANNAVVNLAGSVKIATGGTWSKSGTGNLTDENLLTSIYTLSNEEIIAKSTTLLLTSTGNGTCKAVSDSMKIIVRDSIKINTITSPTTCKGCNGTAAITSILNASYPYSFLWNDGSTDSSRINICDGNYTITVSDNDGCNNSFNTVVTDGGFVKSSFTYVGNGCSLNNNFNFTNTGTEGTNRKYAWVFAGANIASSSQEDPQNISWTNPGTYNVSLTISTDSCIDKSTQVITISEGPSVTAYATDALCFNDYTGAVDATIVNGTQPYTFKWSSGQNTEDITSMHAGIYTLSITDANNCSAIANATVEEPELLSLQQNVTPSSCGQSDGAINIFLSGGTPIYVYAWSNGFASSFLSGLPNGNYVVTVTDKNNCSIEQSIDVSDKDGPVANIVSSTDCLCPGSSEGSAEVLATGGQSPYTYHWSNGANTKKISNVKAGNYYVTVSDSKNCKASTQITIKEPPAPVAVKYTSDVTCFGDADGSISLITNPATTVNSIVWNNGMTGTNISNLKAGVYTYILTDKNGCSTQDSDTIKEPSGMQVSSTLSHVSCYQGANGAIAMTIVGGTQPYYYAWSNTATTNTISALQAGSYTVTISDNNNCQLTKTETLTEPSKIIPNAVVNNAFCGNSNGVIALAVNGGTPTYQYKWNNSSTSALQSNIPSAVYTVTITDSKSCTESYSIEVSDIEGPKIATRVLKDVTCPAGTDGQATVDVISGVSPFTYLWSTSATSATIANLNAGVYAVTVFDNNMCIAAASLTIKEPLPLASTLKTKNVSCNKGSDGYIEVIKNPIIKSMSYLWNNGRTTVAISNLPVGTYSVTLTDNNGCKDYLQTSITEPTEVVSNLTATPVSCFGGADGTITATLNGGTPPYTYQWTPAQTNSATIPNLKAAKYSLKVTDAKKCIHRDTLAVTQPKKLIVDLINKADTVCGGYNLHLTATASGGNGAPYTYSWPLQNVVSGSITYTILKDEKFLVFATDQKGCVSKPDSVTINITSMLKDKLTLTYSGIVCPGKPASILATHQPAYKSIYTFTWNPSLPNNAGPHQLNPKTNDFYRLTISDTCNNQLVDSILVSVYPIPDILLTGEIAAGCEPYTYLFDDPAPSDKKAIFSWDLGNGQTSVLRTPQTTYATAGKYDIKLHVTTSNNCEVENDTASFITVYKKPIVVAEADRQKIDLRDTTVRFSLGEHTEPYAYLQWDFDDDEFSSIEKPVHQFPDTGTYHVSVILIDTNSCRDSSNVNIVVKPWIVISIPNAFTPDPNGPHEGPYDPLANNNDIFYPITVNKFVIEYSFRIFNRWGEMVFFTDNQYIGWDGYYKGELCKQDVYVYKVYVKYVEGSPDNLQGEVNLIR